jgi:multiple sugar transport system ATP-binding protein
MSGVQLKGVQKFFGVAQILRDVDLTIEDGEFCVFVGPSGCGKSTLLRMVAGLEGVSDGDILIAGKRVNGVPAAKRGIAMVFQSYALYPHMTVRENMAFSLKLAGQSRQAIGERVAKAARTLQIEHLLERRPKELSGGQRQRVAIGRAIVRDPGVFLFDEPLSNLDAALRVQTRIEIANLHHAIGKASMIYVTHDQVEAMTLADRIVLLRPNPAEHRDGSIAQIGSPLELYTRPRNLFVAGFIGSPRMNFLSATMETLATVRLANGAAFPRRVTGASGQNVTIGVRAEHVAIAGGRNQVVVPDTVRLDAQVRHVEHLGDASYVYVTVNGFNEPVVARAEPERLLATDARVEVLIEAWRCHIFGADGNIIEHARMEGAA